ncbi:hypothetical protein [Burkholderia glumae]|uniref:hypothetical protein n=1 Tax=Burkholderia glumae TaxID=337 RepID=UPI00214FC57E|nr:hypothetical protein [Burkholderia glumae]
MKKRPALAGHFSSCGAKRGGRRHEAAAPRGHQVAFAPPEPARSAARALSATRDKGGLGRGATQE